MLKFDQIYVDTLHKKSVAQTHKKKICAQHMLERNHLLCKVCILKFLYKGTSSACQGDKASWQKYGFAFNLFNDNMVI